MRDVPAREAALANVSACALACGLAEQGRMTSPIVGSEGNVEFLLWLKRPGNVR